MRKRPVESQGANAGADHPRRYAAGHSQRAIARELNIDRRKVKQILRPCRRVIADPQRAPAATIIVAAGAFVIVPASAALYVAERSMIWDI